jgi:hypothetical protein
MHAQMKGEVHAGNATYCTPAIPYLLYTRCAIIARDYWCAGNPCMYPLIQAVISSTDKVMSVLYISS